MSLLSPQELDAAERALAGWFFSQGLKDRERLAIMLGEVSKTFGRALKNGSLNEASVRAWVDTLGQLVSKEIGT